LFKSHTFDHPSLNPYPELETSQPLFSRVVSDAAVISVPVCSKQLLVGARGKSDFYMAPCGPGPKTKKKNVTFACGG
jgi:hypothetical protein